jgi:hypothetical protein
MQYLSTSKSPFFEATTRADNKFKFLSFSITTLWLDRYSFKLKELVILSNSLNTTKSPKIKIKIILANLCFIVLGHIVGLGHRPNHTGMSSVYTIRNRLTNHKKNNKLLPHQKTWMEF